MELYNLKENNFLLFFFCVFNGFFLGVGKRLKWLNFVNYLWKENLISWKIIWVLLSLFFILISNWIFMLCKIVNRFVLNIMCIKNLFKMFSYV